MSKPVDIIIPIYNAYEDLKICLKSIYSNTDLEQNRLILINDNSPDARIKELLDKQIGKNIIVIHNETNKGFSANINIGMSQSEENDVLLLNSDTVVTANWIDKIVTCAYSDRSIGTVTPLSNNATLCSVPVFCEENKLPDNLSVDKMAEIVERCSMRKYPQITVAHGFCMFVKREVIDAVGNFDAATFGRGYGEENDFCNRAGQAGYKHVMCDDTYILHTGTKSFVSAEKAAYIEEHDRILRKRYPIQMHENDVHVRDNPNHFVGDNISVYMDVFNGKKNLLYVLQSDFRRDASDNVGGTQLHVKDLTKNMTDEYNVFVAARDGVFLNLTIYTEIGNKLWKFYIGTKPAYYSFSDQKLNKIWRNVLSAFRIDCVHVHHLCTTSFDVVYIAHEYGIPVIFTLHDYFMVSPSLKLLNEKDEVITWSEENPDTWKNYLKTNYAIYDNLNYMSIWRNQCGNVLELCKKIVVPDESVKKIVSEYYPQIADRLVVIPHGYEFTKQYEKNQLVYTNQVKYAIEYIKREGFTFKICGWAYTEGLEKNATEDIYLLVETENESITLSVSRKKRDDVAELSGRSECGFECLLPLKLIGEKKLKIRIIIKCGNGTSYCSVNQSELPMLEQSEQENKLNIAFIGGINKEKGGEEIAKIVRQNTDDVNWFLFGNVGCPELENLTKENYAWFGGYNSNDLPDLMDLHKIDIICILSIWPETYSYTLTEALLCGKPVIVTDIGALGNRVKKMQCGWTLDINNVQSDFTELLKSLLNDRNILDEYSKRVSRIKMDSLEEMAAKYKDLYEPYWKNEKQYELADYEYLYKIYESSLNGENLSGNREEKLGGHDISFYMNAIEEYRNMTNTVTYRICKKVQALHFPGRKMLYKWLKDRV